MSIHKILNILPQDNLLQDKLSKTLKISKILSQLLINRQITTVEEADKFLNANVNHLLDPYDFSQMPLAVNLIKKIAKNKDKVMIFGDYDVDGVTSLAMLKKTFSCMGIEAEHYIPHRIKEGYGLNKNIINMVKQKKIKLLITVDCGTNSYAEIKELRRQNVEVIVVDHHEPLNQVLFASSILNPKLSSSQYKDKDLAAVGVVYKLCQALLQEKLIEDLDLVCLGTIADVVPLRGENRIIVKEGLLRINQTKKPGLKALLEISGIKNKKINTTFVSYILGPRLNASGRLDTANTALDLLLTQKIDEAEELAKIIEAYNRQRQKIEDKILLEAEAIIEREVNFKENRVIVLSGLDWHQGVIGIVASKLAERFYRPTILISLGKNLCKGSGRSIKNFHLFNALLDCKEFLHTFGGHRQAVGLVIAKDKIEDFKKRINYLAQERLVFEDLLPRINIDMELNLASLNEKLVQEIMLLEPFGVDNPLPLFYTRNLKLKTEPKILGRDTLKFWVTDGSFTYPVIGFGLAEYYDSLFKARNFSLVYTLRQDTWESEDSIILEAKDIFF